MKWLAVAVLWGVAVLNYLDRQVVFSLLPLLEHDLHATAFQLGLISSVFLWTYGLLSPLGGFMADRFGRSRVIWSSLAIWSLATWLTGHVASIQGMLWTRALMGVSEAFYLPAALALIADLHGSETVSLATGLHQSGLYTGLVLGGAWGGWMGERSGWRDVFSILGVAGIVYLGIVVFTLRRESPRAGARGSAGLPFHLLRMPDFLVLAGAFTALSVANWIVYTWLPMFLYASHHLSLSGAGFSATVYLQAASYLGVIVGGALTDRWARRYPRARAWVQMTGLAIAAPFLAALGVTGSMFVLICALIAFGIGRGLFDCNTMPLLRSITGPGGSATGYGILNLAGALAGGLGAAAAGWMKETVGLAAAFELAALVLVAGAVPMLTLARHRAFTPRPKYSRM